jgi:Ni/Co efflux regulator RcnB
MNKKALVFAVAAAALTSGAAFAQSYGYSNDSNVRNERYVQQDRHDSGERDGRYSRDGRDGRYSRDGRDGRYDRNDHYGRDDRYSRRDRNDYGDNRYYAQPRAQHFRGGYVQQQYRDQRYVVSDWRSRRLYQPQRGYQWVQAGNDYLLVAIATGLIAQVLMNQ